MAGRRGQTREALAADPLRARFLDVVNPSDVIRVNDSGMVVGNGTFADGTRGPFVYWTDADVLTPLKLLVAPEDLMYVDEWGNPVTRTLRDAADINSAGQIVGRATVKVGTNPSFDDAFRLWPDGAGYRYESLGPLVAKAINDDGLVAGYLPDTPWHAVVCAGPGMIEDLGTYDGNSTVPKAISEANTEGPFHLVGGVWVLHPDGQWTVPDIDVTKDGAANSSNDVAVSPAGRIMSVGRATISRWASRAYRYTEGLGTENLGSLARSPSNSWDFDGSEAFGINDAGWVVGESFIGDGGTARAFLYIDPYGSSTYGIVNLDKLITDFDSDADRLSWTGAGRITARSINNAAVICGEGSFPEGTRAFVVVPVTGP